MQHCEESGIANCNDSNDEDHNEHEQEKVAYRRGYLLLQPIRLRWNLDVQSSWIVRRQGHDTLSGDQRGRTGIGIRDHHSLLANRANIGREGRWDHYAKERLILLTHTPHNPNDRKGCGTYEDHRARTNIGNSKF
jgi:hypothetical protein